jgi:hypothetical protein
VICSCVKLREDVGSFTVPCIQRTLISATYVATNREHADI